MGGFTFLPSSRTSRLGWKIFLPSISRFFRFWTCTTRLQLPWLRIFRALHVIAAHFLTGLLMQFSGRHLYSTHTPVPARWILACLFVLIEMIAGKSDILQYRQPQIHRVNFWSTTVKFPFYNTLRAENGNVCWPLMNHFQYGFDFRNNVTRESK